MHSAILRKSVTDLTRRKARSLFAVASLALAVASIGIFALPSLTDRAMQEEIRAGRLADVALSIPSPELSESQLAELRGLPNVAGLQPRSYFHTRVYIGDRRETAIVVGVPDFADQPVDVVRLDGTAPPAAGTVLSERQNRQQGVYDVSAGEVARLVAADGSVRELPVAGEARNLDQGQDVILERLAILYATQETVAALTGEAGFDSLLVRLDDTSDQAAAATVTAIGDRLRAWTGAEPFTNLPEVRAAGDWPGKEELEQYSSVLYIVTLLALLSAVVLIANTMTTLIGEQTGEIGTMKAIGGRRRQIARIYLTTALLLGAMGAVLGAVLGLVLANVLTQFFGSTFFAVEPGFEVHVPVLVASVVVGLVAPALAALPSIRRATRLSVREALDVSAASLGGDGLVDRALRRAPFLPRTAQIGLRSVARRKRRSLATILIVGLAVANFLAVMGLANAVQQTVREGWADHREDLRLFTAGREGFDEEAQRLIRETPGVAQAQPALVQDVEIEDEPAFAWGVPHDTLLTYHLTDGRWFTPDEERASARVAILERSVAELAGKRVGDTTTVQTAAGPAEFEVVGIASNQQEGGFVAFVPLSTLRAVAGSPTRTGTFWIQTTSSDHALVDRTAASLEDALTARGYEPATEITYVLTQDELAAYRTITTSIAVLGFVIVAISLVALVNAMTMSVLERTREIGILRCLGARARDVRRILTSEGIVLAVLGWILGVPLGYVLEVGISRLLREELNVEVPVVFPAGNVALVLAGTVLLCVAVLVLPVRRAVHLRPGDALRQA